MGGLSLLAASHDLPAPGPPPQQLTLKRRDGGTINAFDWGGDGAPTLFLHGGALSAHTWDLVCPLLRRDLRCVALDLRGHGDSDWAESYLISDHVDDIHCAISQLGWRQAHLVGMSLGGVCAAHAALDADGFSPASLSLIDVAPGVDFSATKVMRSFIEEDAAYGGVSALIEKARKAGARSNDAHLFYRYATLLKLESNGEWRWKWDMRQKPDYQHILGRLDELDGRASELKNPCLIARGGLSRILSDAAAKKFAHKLPDGAWVRIENAGHSIQEDNPRDLADAILDFIQQI